MKTLFIYLRKCECGVIEVQHAGPMGDNKWRSIDLPFDNSWEGAAV